MAIQTASDIIRSDLQAEPMPAGIAQLVEVLRARYPQSLQAVIYYGSCRRRSDNIEGLVDLLAVVSGYRACHGAGLTALANRVLPPNVYYLEAGNNHLRYRSKYAVVSLPGFLRRCSGGLDAYFWARFAQPCRLAWSRNEKVTEILIKARLSAVVTFAQHAAPRMVQGELDAAGFWEQALSASYRCELRPERDHAARDLVQSDVHYWRAISAAVLPDINGITVVRDDRYRIQFDSVARLRAVWEWRLRGVWGKALNLARLFKAAGTFANGLDYLLWKVERHSGVRVEITPAMRRYPRLAACRLAWQLWRKGGFR
jgi:hypothetical protein